MRHRWLAACLGILLAAFAALGGLAACSRRPLPARPGAAAPTAPAPSRPAPAAPPRPAPAPPPVSVEQAMLAQPSPRLLPEDFDIGPLGDRLGGSRAERQARGVAVRFLAGLAAGQVPAAEILPERRGELGRSLQYYLDRRLLPSRYRLGPLIELEEGSLRCRVRLYGGGSTAGELYFAAEQGAWYVADVQVGLAALGAAPPRRAGKFVPSEVR